MKRVGRTIGSAATLGLGLLLLFGGQPAASQGSLLGVPFGGDAPGDPPVWCVMQRQAADGNPERTVIRCDDMGGAGPGWTAVATNLTFAAASEMRDSFNAANPAAVWCVMRRRKEDGVQEETVIRCDDMGGAGPGWMPVEGNLTFATASAMRDAFNAAPPP